MCKDEIHDAEKDGQVKLSLAGYKSESGSGVGGCVAELRQSDDVAS
jgi:hypothetical protein